MIVKFTTTKVRAEGIVLVVSSKRSAEKHMFLTFPGVQEGAGRFSRFFSIYFGDSPIHGAELWRRKLGFPMFS